MEEKSYSIIKSRAWYNIDKKPGKGRRDLDRSGSSLPSLLFLRERSPSSADVVIIQLGFFVFFFEI